MRAWARGGLAAAEDGREGAAVLVGGDTAEPYHRGPGRGDPISGRSRQVRSAAGEDGGDGAVLLELRSRRSEKTPPGYSALNPYEGLAHEPQPTSEAKASTSSGVTPPNPKREIRGTIADAALVEEVPVVDEADKVVSR